MRNSFVTDQTMVISIPAQSFNHVWPEQFHCRFRDAYKSFIHYGRPKPLGAAQVTTGVFLLLLCLMFDPTTDFNRVYIVPAVVYVVTGLVSFASSQTPNMRVTKLSLYLNIFSLLLSVGAVCFGIILFNTPPGDGKQNEVHHAIRSLIWSLLVIEDAIALFLIYWISKAVCKQHFNILPVVLLKQSD